MSVILSTSKSRSRREGNLQNMPWDNLKQTISATSTVHNLNLQKFIGSYKNMGFISLSVREIVLRILCHNDHWNQDMLEVRGLLIFILYTFFLVYDISWIYL